MARLEGLSKLANRWFYTYRTDMRVQASSYQHNAERTKTQRGGQTQLGHICHNETQHHLKKCTTSASPNQSSIKIKAVSKLKLCQN